MVRSLVIIPTFNERENVESLVGKLLSLGEDIHLLFVDDNSPDGTNLLVSELAQKSPNHIFLLQRKQREGLGKAYAAGFAWALRRGYKKIVQMDADHSHNPKYLRQFLDLLEHTDFIVGSRNIPGGGVVGWGLLRNFVSRFGSLYARLILRKNIRDFTGGYNAWRSEVVEKILEKEILSRGYAFQVEMKYRALLSGFRCSEVPIIFEDRCVGRSKMSSMIAIEAAYKVLQLRLKMRL